jgi:hypothetical protein
MSTAEGSLVIRVGALDGKEALEEGKPSAEIYTCGRAGLGRWPGRSSWRSFSR